jgi:hypothetical protein
VRLGDGVTINKRFLTIIDKYTAHIYPSKTNGTLIKIGCELHKPGEWKTNGRKYAKKHNEVEWWDSVGKNILELLIKEAELYDRR